MLDMLHGIEVFPSSDCLSFTSLSLSLYLYLSISHYYFSILKPPCILTLCVLTLHPPFPLSCFYLYLYLYLVQGVSPIGSGAGSQDVRVQVQVMGWVMLFLPRLAFKPPPLCVMFLPRLAFMPPLLCVMFLPRLAFMPPPLRVMSYHIISCHIIYSELLLLHLFPSIFFIIIGQVFLTNSMIGSSILNRFFTLKISIIFFNLNLSFLFQNLAF